MNISAFELRFQFTEDTRLRTPIKIVSELLGEEISEEIEPVILRKEREKFAVMWSYDGFGVLKEDIGSVQACINKFLKTTELVS